MCNWSYGQNIHVYPEACTTDLRVSGRADYKPVFVSSCARMHTHTHTLTRSHTHTHCSLKVLSWLNVFNAELSPKMYWRGPRSQEEGVKRETTSVATLSPPE